MKRKISLVIAFALSFLFMFSPIAKAEETKFNTVTTSEPIELEVVKMPQDTNKGDSPPQVMAKVPVIDKPMISIKACVICQSPDGQETYVGRWAWVGGVRKCLATCN